MAGRSFLLQPAGEQPPLLQRALKLPQVSDGMIQGKSVRVILKKRPRRRYSQRTGMPPLR
jgi:ABC-2 type transport system ATP-binding protein